jgi:hypothetical protein
MTSHDDEFAKKITGYLDAGAAELRAGTAYRLQLARQAALARLTAPETVRTPQLTPALAGAGGIGGPTGSLPGFRINVKLWLGILLIVVAAFGYQQWRAYQLLTEIEETDAAILSSDLPIDAYLDRGFQNWLHSDPD